MKGALAAAAVAGLLAVVAVPALALATAADETAPGQTVRTDGPGPPPWAHERGPDRDAMKQAWKDQRRQQHDAWKDRKREQMRAWKDQRGEHDGPPPWAGGPWRQGR